MASSIIFNDRPRIGQKLWVDDEDTFNKVISNTKDEYLLEVAHQFRENGFVIVRNAATEELCDQAISAYHNWCDNNEDPDHYKRANPEKKRVVNIHTEVKAFKNLFTRSKKLLEVQDFLFGYPSCVYTSLTFKHGTEQPIHRDTPVFSTSPKEYYFGLWFALENVSMENGCLTMIPGGHREEFVSPFDFAEANVNDINEINPNGVELWGKYQNEVVSACKSKGLIQDFAPMQKGDALLWHPQLPHGGSKINNPSLSRYSIVYHVVPEGTPVYQADVFFNRNRQEESDEAQFSYEKYEERLFRIGIGTHYGGQ